MLVQPDWPDVEAVAMALLATLAPTGTATPPNLAGPFIAIRRAGGPADLITDRPRLVLDCFGSDRPSAWALARQVQQAVIAAGNKTIAGALIDTAAVRVGLQEIPYGNPNLRRVSGQYELTFRRPRTA